MHDPALGVARLAGKSSARADKAAEVAKMGWKDVAALEDASMDGMDGRRGGRDERGEWCPGYFSRIHTAAWCQIVSYNMQYLTSHWGRILT